MGAIGMNIVPTMTERMTPERVWREYLVDFKGPIEGKYYQHTIQDNLSRWPEVEVVETMSFSKLRLAFERSFGVFGIPEKIIHDRGPPYNSQK